MICSSMRRPTLHYEKNLFARGIQSVVGIDEVGRGAWAGPLVAAAVLITPETLKKIQSSWKIRQEIRLIRDSKILSPLKRALAFRIIARHFPYAYGVVDSQIIDERGLSFANQFALDCAIENLSKAPEYILCDGRGFCFKQKYENVIDGDAKIFCISAASIVAKVTRDRMMKKYHKKFREYAFHRHKGYGTKLHIKMLKKHGICPIHRKSFEPIQGFVGKADF